MAHWLFLPDDALGDLEVLAATPPDKIETLRSLLDSVDFRLQPRSFVKVAELLGISDESAAGFCTFVDYVQRQRSRYAQTAQAVLEELEAFLKRTAQTDDLKKRAERVIHYLRDNAKLLISLFSELPEHAQSEKVRELEQGPVPHLQSFRAYCDMRPVYDSGADEIVSCFPVITLHLVTHSAETGEAKEVLVQLTEPDLTEFRKQFNRLDKKLARLKTSYANLPTKKGSANP